MKWKVEMRLAPGEKWIKWVRSKSSQTYTKLPSTRSSGVVVQHWSVGRGGCNNEISWQNFLSQNPVGFSVSSGKHRWDAGESEKKRVCKVYFIVLWVKTNWTGIQITLVNLCITAYQDHKRHLITGKCGHWLYKIWWPSCFPVSKRHTEISHRPKVSLY